MLKADISNKIQEVFEEEASTAESYLINNLDSKTDRIQRCVVHLSDGSLEELNYYINAANTDFRDVITWAEDDENYNQVYDFNRPFPVAKITIKDPQINPSLLILIILLAIIVLGLVLAFVKL